MSDTRLLIGLVGDLLVDRDEPEEAFAAVRALLDAPDVLFGNLEGVYTDDPQPAPSLGVPVFPKKACGRAFGALGFDVLSMANNHIVDAGHRAMLETADDMRAQGVRVAGAGANLAAARAPAVVESHGIKTAFLCYASVFPMGYEARSDVPGLAPVRAYNFFREAYPNYHIPGTLGQVQTVPDAGDMANLAADIAAARADADLVVTSFHWGDFLRAHHLTDHERRTARFCIDHGADIVVGHHHHMLRGMEWVEGKPVLYGVGHFVFDLKMDLPADLAALLSAIPADSYMLAPREGWPNLPMHPDARLTLMAYVETVGARPVGMGFVPCRLRADGRVEAVDPESEEGREVVAYVRTGQSSQKLNGRIECGGASIGGFPSVRVVPLE